MIKSIDGTDAVSLLAVNALKEAIAALKPYPNALNAYLSAERKTLMDARWIPDTLQSTLIALQTQRNILGTIRRDRDSFNLVLDAENIALDASSTIIRMAKHNPEVLQQFLYEQQRFYAAYSDSFERPNIQSLYNFIEAEITVLENEELKKRIVNNAHHAIMKAIKEALLSLNKYPEALTAFQSAEQTYLETKKENELSQSLIDSHVLLLKAHKSLISIYKAHPESYKNFVDTAFLTLKNRNEIYHQLNDNITKTILMHSLILFEERYITFLNNPATNMEPFRDFLHDEIQQLQKINLSEPESAPDIMELRNPELLDAE